MTSTATPTGLRRRDIVASVGTNIKYAAIHQFGGPTRPHVILHHNKKALAFGGRVVKKVNHPGSRIPARPFLSITPEDEDKIIGKVSAAPAGMNRIEDYLL